MKVVFLGDSISTQQAGIHYYGLQLVKRIVSQYPKHTYCIIVTSPLEQLSIPQEIVPYNKMIPGHLRWRQIFTLPKVIRRMQPDLVIELAHFGPFNLGRQIRRATVVHDLTPILFPEFHSFMSVQMHRLLFPRIVRKADFLIANSRQTKSDLVELLGISPTSVHVVEPQIADLIPEAGFCKESSAKKYFITVGTREPRKNQIVILKAFEQFCEEYDDFGLIIVGKEGWRNGAFDRAYQSSPVKDKVKLKGYVDRDSLMELYRGAFAFIQSSFYEGFGIPLIEAQSFGLPLLVSRNDSVPDIVAQNAILFDQGSAEDLLHQMNRLANDGELRSKMSILSQEAFREHNGKQLDLDEIFGEKNDLAKRIEQPT